MKNDQVQALNYCAHAIDDLRATEVMLRPMAPMTATVLRRLTALLENSIKFILPNCCDLINPDDMKQSHLDLIHLPYPCVAFEAPWEKAHTVDEIAGMRQTPATKRIALCFEARPEYEVLPGLFDIVQSFPAGGVFVVPIYWGPEYRKWTVALGGTFVPYENEVKKFDVGVEMPVSRIANQAVIDAGLAKTGAKQFRAEPFYLLPEFFDRAVEAAGGRNQAFAQIMMDSRDEAMMLVQACSVINCANVTTATVDAPAALNKKRRASGKQLFFSYKVLQLSEEKRGAGTPNGGEHASPRMHLRRGHLRRLDSKVVWVRPTMVNADSPRGVVAKDYAL
ncbi:hypothetical protein EGT07_23680 [Herbaspirillum sp. HC18]|nr:hypothetical protein EGT07_23680 [Herbaspirillum sp. HC18]